jgi:hypothetical protein
MARVILHIGPHKTGTTSLQEDLHAMRDSLAQAGIVYPDRWRQRSAAHHALFYRVKAIGGTSTPEAEAALRADIEEVRGDAACLVVSSESFSTLGPDAIAALRRVLEGHRVEVVYFVRRWSGLLPSFWQQEVKFGRGPILPSFCRKHLADPSRSHVLNAKASLNRFATAFGDDAIRIGAYDAVVDAKQSLVSVFLRRAAGVPLEPPPKPSWTNASLTPELTEALRALNVMAAREAGHPVLDHEVWRALESIGEAAAAPLAVLRKAMQPHLATLRLENHSDAFVAMQRELVDRFGQHRITGEGDEPLFGTPSASERACAHVAGGYQQAPGVAGALAELHAMVGEIRRQRAAG